MLRFWLRIMPLLGRDPHKFGRNGDIDLPAIIKDGSFPVHAEIDIHDVIDLKDEAADCHISQLGGGPPRRGPISWLVRRYSMKEQFMRAYPPAEDGLWESDLFAGVR
jgi:LmbE family N-acetylglucosaminyl deacetylase